MIFAILLLPSILASWFCYWFSSVFPSLSNRTSRIICIACPFVTALILAIVLSTTLDLPATNFEMIPHRPGTVIGSLFVAIAAVFVFPTLLLAFAAARLKNHFSGNGNRQA